MRYFKVAAVALGALIVLLVVSSALGFLIEVAIAALVAAAVVLGIKAAFYKKQVSGKMPDKEVRGPAGNSLPRRQKTPGVDDELARLKREMRD
jgi:negative regulator of sigma E activity